MKEPQILSAFQDLPANSAEAAAARAPSPVPARALVFDACRAGVILRAVLFVETAVGVGAMFGSANFLEWLTRLSLLTGGALPATLTWLIAACSLKRPLARLPRGWQHLAGVAIGALAGLYGCGMLALINFTGFAEPAPWLASAAAGALLAALVVAGLLLRARAQAPAATTARLEELQARIQPHFLFNTLNSAIALVRAEPAKAEALLEDLSDLFRHALVDRGEAVTLAQEVQLAERYLSIEQVRFGDRLHVTWALDPAADQARLPPLLLQPLVENAVKHGVEPSAAGAELRISTERRGGIVVIKVANTVPAGPGAPGHGLAQDNVRDRLNLLHDVQGRFQAQFKDGVYQVRIEVPA
ncbi:sensor histidine kinase [Rhodoferax koreense]|uniref:Sensor histidine kinase n=1 Tax=Rhodoferax koreensis TaxID=1842727 RepID=A0A1P8JYR4_9BURK|nr:sensor histidine kinase [Rhodoferax koreense]APW38831.1 sensor histidine kinase [Rhodoferax koreense]